MEYTPFPKIARLNRPVVITEKIDGTNGSIFIQEAQNPMGYPTGFEESVALAKIGNLYLYAGSRTRWLNVHDDNYGFASWAKENAEDLIKLGPGLHFGEWWGYGINRGYGFTKEDGPDARFFSLFNTHRWNDDAARPFCCNVVPTLWTGNAKDLAAGIAVAEHTLRRYGSQAYLDYMDPEGYVVYHTAANLCFKVTLKGDEEGKSQEAHVKKVKAPRPAKNPNIGGRRKQQIEIAFADRRVPK